LTDSFFRKEFTQLENQLEYFRKNALRTRRKAEEAAIIAELWEERYQRELDAEELQKMLEDTGLDNPPAAAVPGEKSLGEPYNEKLHGPQNIDEMFSDLVRDDVGWQEYTNQGME
jgi:hypothetical protein